YKTVSATLSYDPVACPCCHQKNINNSILKHGFKQVKVKYACSLSCPKLSPLKKQRFICKACKKTFMAQTNLVEPNCQISNLQKQLVKEQLRLVQSASLIAHNTYVSISTVVRVLDSLEKQMKPQTNILPTTLSFDELRTTKSCKGGLSFILCQCFYSPSIRFIR
ncbi:Transposase and inactivated derivatives, partial [Globicatella sulfidifaciens DSM 15739]